MKTGLVIQGPILSPDYRLNEFHSDGTYQKNWISQESMENLKKILLNSSKFFDVIVLVTWIQAKNGAFLDEIAVPGRVVVIEIEEGKFLASKRREGIGRPERKSRDSSPSKSSKE